jgi:hypothetical protein
MSTIHLRPTHPQLWWYAAAAVLAGAVLALIIATLQVSSQGRVDIAPPSIPMQGHFKANPYTCRAGHPVPNMDLPRCVSPVG